jgi:lambda family phage portal protein
MGVELNGIGRPVAYHLHEQHPNGNLANASARIVRVPAGDILHVYTTERPEQHRGIPWMHTAMLRLENLGKFERAALTAARKGAQSLGFFQSPDGEPPPGEEVDEAGNQIHTSVEGEFDTLPPGYQFQQFDSKYPSDIYGTFVKDCLRSISSGLGVAYNGLANDLEGVNFSSIRAGVLEERDVWMTLQTWMSEHVLTPIFREWLSMALLSGRLGTLPAMKFEKFVAHSWQPRRWPWVDPRADMEAKLMAIRAGLDTRRDVAAEQGKDFDDVAEQLKAENELLASLGVESDLGGAKPAGTSSP